MRLARLLVLLAALAVWTPAASAATVTSDGATVRVVAAPGEVNTVDVSRDTLPGDPATLTVRDTGTPPVAGGGCAPMLDPSAVSCPVGANPTVSADLGDGDDSFSMLAPVPANVRGGPGADVVYGGGAADTIDAGPGADVVDCGAGPDRVKADVGDQIDLSCERVDYGPLGQVGPIRVVTGGGRFVAVPGQPGTQVDRRILPDVLYLVRRYHLRLGDGFKVGGNHKAAGEHPLGLGLDIYPGAGGGWDAVDRLARWAEPRQNRPRMPFRWVGYNGDVNHGRGNHLHLSWRHSPGRPGRPVRTVWTWAVGR